MTEASARTRAVLVPANPSERFARVFAWYVGRMLRRDFEGVVGVPGTMETLRGVQSGSRPGIVVMSHASWWDPLVGFHLHRLSAPGGGSGRRGLAPMEAGQLARFAFFRRLGIFGLDPDAAGSGRAMVDYVAGQMARDARTTLWITGQGRFADPREPMRLQPGAAALAARVGEVSVAAVAIEYAFWQSRRPRVFVNAVAVDAPPRPSTSGWLRTMNAGLARAAQELAARVIARSPEGFEPLAGDRGRPGPSDRINPVYDLWLRLRGRSGGIEASRSREEVRP